MQAEFTNIGYFYLTRNMSVFRLGRFSCFVALRGGKLRLFVVVQRGIGDFVDGGGDGLHLAHNGPDGDTLVFFAEIAVRIRFHRFKSKRNGGTSTSAPP